MASLNEELCELRESLVTWAAGWGLGPDDAQDLAQDVLLKVLQHLGQFRRESRLSSWAYRIAQNERVNQARRSLLRVKVEGSFASTCPTCMGAGDDAVLRALDACRRIDALMRRGMLSDAELELFEMVAVKGQSSVEVGSRLGVPPGTIRLRLSKAAARLRREVA